MNPPRKVSAPRRNAPSSAAAPHFHASSSGFSLVEVLITALLIGIGMLGMAALQSRAVAYTTEAVQRTTAAMLASELLELIRATPGQWSSYLQAGAPEPASAASCRTTPSQPAEQLACWLDDIASLLPGSADLPGGTSYVCRASAPGICGGNGSVIEVQVAWKGAYGDCPSAESFCHHRLRSDL